MRVDLSGTMRFARLFGFACVELLFAVQNAGAGEVWTLDSRSCTLSRKDHGRAFSVTLSYLPDTTDRGVVGLAFEEPKLIQGAKKALATLKFDNGTSESHRLEVTPAGPLLVPIVTMDLQSVLQNLSESRKLTVATHFGSTSFSLEGIANRIPALRDCAS